MTRAMIAKVQIARKELGLHDDDYRSTLERLTGRRSAAELDERQLLVVLEEFKRRGFQPRTINGGKTDHGRPGSAAQHDTARKARAMWISLWQLGAIRNKSEKALEAFAQRQLKCERLVWADQQQMFKLIEALKNMAQRNGWDQDLSGISPGAQLLTLKRRLIAAQCKKLDLLSPSNLRAFGNAQLADMTAQLAVLIRQKLPEASE